MEGLEDGDGEEEGAEGEELDEEELDEGEEEEEEDEDEAEEEGAEDEEEEDEEEEGEGEEDAQSLQEVRQALAEAQARLHELTQQAEEEEETEQLTTVQEEDLEFDDFLEEDDAYDRAMESREAFNEVLKNVAKQASLTAVRQVLQRVPQMVSRQVAEGMTTQQLVTDFFRQNPDLVPARRYVAYIYTTVQAEHPEKSQAELLAITATEARKGLGLEAGRAQKAKKAGKKAARRGSYAPGGRVGRRSARPKKPQGIGEEIAAMLSAK